MSSASGGPIADSVRLAWPAEAASIAELQRRSWATQWPADLAELMLASVSLTEMTDSWRSAIERPPQAAFRVLVATDGTRVVGFATTMPSQDDDADPSMDGAIDQFVVDPAAQHRGHGSRLLNACADTLRADGFGRACCWVNASDDALRRFLTAAGWAADGATREIGPEDESVRLKQVRLHTRPCGRPLMLMPRPLGRDRQVVARQVDLQAVFSRHDLGDRQAEWHPLERDRLQQRRPAMPGR